MKELLLEAAEYLDSYYSGPALIDKLRAAADRMEWVPVAERLPDEYPCDVWLAWGSNGMRAQHFRCKPHAEPLLEQGYTHWQYAIISEPPKEGKS